MPSEQKLTQVQIANISKLHKVVLENSSINMFGMSGIKRFYRFLTTSNEEMLFTDIENEYVRGVAVLSLDAKSLSHRFVSSHPVILAMTTALYLIFHPHLIFKFIGTALSGDPRPESLAKEPEVILIFTNPDFRNQRVGSSLLKKVEDDLKTLGRSSYVVKTENDSNNKAVGFYEKNGFSKHGVAEQAGTSYVYFIKKL